VYYRPGGWHTPVKREFFGGHTEIINLKRGISMEGRALTTVPGLHGSNPSGKLSGDRFLSSKKRVACKGDVSFE